MGWPLYKLLGGHAPFSCPPDRPAFEVMRGHLEQQPPALRKLRDNVPAEVAATVNRMLAKDPARRFQTPAEVADALGAFAATADLAALSHRAGQTPPPDSPRSPHHETQSSLVSSATQFFNSLKVGALGVVRKRPKPGLEQSGKRRRTYSLLVRALGGVAAALLLGVAALLWNSMGREKTVAEKQPAPRPTVGQLLVTLPQDERQGAKLQIDGKAQDIPSGGDPIKLPLSPGEHALRIERPHYWAYTWSGKIEGGKDQALQPQWEAIPTAQTAPDPTPAAAQKPADGQLVVALPQDERQARNWKSTARPRTFPPAAIRSSCLCPRASTRCGSSGRATRPTLGAAGLKPRRSRPSGPSGRRSPRRP